MQHRRLFFRVMSYDCIAYSGRSLALVGNDSFKHASLHMSQPQKATHAQTHHDERRTRARVIYPSPPPPPPARPICDAQDMQLVSSRPGHVCCTLEVQPQLQNRYGTLHGGAIGERPRQGGGVVGCAAGNKLPQQIFLFGGVCSSGMWYSSRAAGGKGQRHSVNQYMSLGLVASLDNSSSRSSGSSSSSSKTGGGGGVG
jgi:hypothetical protein